MSRIQEVNSSGNIQYQRFAPKVQIQYNPITDDGEISFFVERYLVVDGKIESRIDKESVLSYPLMALAGRFFADEDPDPATGLNLQSVSGAGVMLLIKKAFNRLMDEKYESEKPVSASNTLVRVDKNSAFSNGIDSITMTVELRDENNEGFPLAGGMKTVRFEPSGGQLFGDVINNKDGTYSQQIVSDTEQLVQVDIFVDNEEMTRNINIEFI